MKKRRELVRHVYAALAVLLLVVTLAGCAAAPKMENTTQASEGRSLAPAQPPAVAPAARGATDNGLSSASTAPQDTERMIVRTGDVTLVVSDAATALQSVTDLVTSAGGYVSDQSSWRDGEQLRARLTVRVPATGLDSVLAALRGLAVRVDREDVRGQDVTEEFSDLGGQLRNLEATENELRELMVSVRERTQSAEEILQVYRELTRIRGEIERVKGRINYLSNVTALATLKIELVPDILAKPVVEPGWRPQESLQNASRQLVNTMKGLVEAGIWLVIYVVPVLVVVALPFVLLFLAIRWLVRRARGPQPPAAGGAGGKDQAPQPSTTN